jgi:hypothetical protein
VFAGADRSNEFGDRWVMTQQVADEADAMADSRSVIHGMCVGESYCEGLLNEHV